MIYRILGLVAFVALGGTQVVAQEDSTEDSATLTDAATQEASNDDDSTEKKDATESQEDEAKDPDPKEDVGGSKVRREAEATGESPKGIAYCLGKCTPDTCKADQEGFQACMDQCRGKFEGLIRGCKLAGQKAGFKDKHLKENAKFTPCPPEREESLQPLSTTPSPVKGALPKDSERSQESEALAKDEESDANDEEATKEKSEETSSTEEVSEEAAPDTEEQAE